MDKREYYKEYYKNNKQRINNLSKQFYLNKKKPIIINTKTYKKGQLVRLSDGRTGIVIKDYGKYIRLNVTAGESYYSECFYREDIV